jgi:O-antigen ligase
VQPRHQPIPSAPLPPTTERPTTWLSGLTRSSVEAAPLVASQLGVGVLLFWARDQAGYTKTAWLGGALALLVLLTIRVATERLSLRGLPRPLQLAVGSLALFVVWNFLSITWAVAKGPAWDGANRSLLYLIVFLLFLLPQLSARHTVSVLTVIAGGIAAIGVVTVIRAAGAADPHSYVIGGRLAEPAGYPNANSALFLLPFWAALWLASRSASSLATRIVGLASAGALLELGTMPQSRGGVIAAPLALLLFFAVARERLRALAMLGAIGVAWLLALPSLLHPYRDAGTSHGLHEALLGARNAIVVSALGLALAAAVLAALDARLQLGERRMRMIRRAVAVLLCLCAGGGIALAARDVAHPRRRLEHAWTQFKHGAEPTTGSTRFTGIGSNRYDFWRVALDEFQRHPLNGVGVDNFAIDYVRARRSNEEPRYPHSILLRLLSETGIVGALLFAGFLGGVGATLLRLRRRGSSFERDLAALAVTCFGYWLLHGAVDWFWEFAGLGSLAFATIGLAASTSRSLEPAPAPSRSLLRWALVPVAVVALCSFALPWLSARDMAQAEGLWRTDTPAAFRALDKASRLNPLTEEPDLEAALIAAQVGDAARMRASLLRSRKRLPENWYVHFELGLLYGVEHRRRAALAELDLAQRLDPLDPIVATIRDRVERGRKLTLTTPDRLFLSRIGTLTR